MEDFNKMLEELQTLMGHTDEQSQQRRDEIALWVKEHQTPEIEHQMRTFLERGLKDLKDDIMVMRCQIREEIFPNRLKWQRSERTRKVV